jgi:DNA-binding NarL/FixJ family response regulator
MSRLRIVVADDYQPMRDSLVRLLSEDFDVVDAVDNGEAVVEAASRLKPDVLVLDIAMPVMSGVAAAAQLRADGSDVRIVFITMHPDREFVERAAAFGAIGFVVKDRMVLDLVPAIQEVVAGRAFISPTLRD